jgi:hypothetical protein
MNIGLARTRNKPHLGSHTEAILLIGMCEHKLGSAVGKADVLLKISAALEKCHGKPSS